MKKLSIVIASLAAFVSAPAFAADMAVKARPAPVVAPVAYNWTGFYLGFSSGGSYADVEYLGVGAAGPLNHMAKGGLVGGTIGFNYQVASWVFGIEADYSYANIHGTVINLAGAPAFELDTELQSFGTVRGRLGYAVGPMLFYATGGFAFGDIESTISPRLGAAFAPFSADEFTSGWTGGFGFEYAAMMSPLTWKIEWLYYDLDTERLDYAPLLAVDADVRYEGHLIRTGLNYRFNWAAAPVVAKY